MSAVTDQRSAQPEPGPTGTALRLMLAAAEAFADKGFHATTTRDIASRAGLSPAGVYVHFASKELLLYQLSKDGHETALSVLQVAAEQADGPREALAEMVRRFTTWHAEHFTVARIVQYEFQHLTPEHRAEIVTLRKRIEGAVHSVIEDGVAAGEFEVADVATTTLAVLSLAIDVARWFAPGKRRTPEAIGDAYADLALRLVAAH
ncbi:MAG: TetR/AcrR family transcriptional regulator [Micrococcales bacterium]|nr:TetR/AcrR family transcriptional regulator [Micrococcales bacterium]